MVLRAGRGQYRDRLAYGTAAERRRFELEFPRDQLIEKTDLAKFEVTFECRPHIVSRGAQKCFLEYAEKIGKAWEISEAPFNEHWFRIVVAKAIAFRWTDKMIGGSDWYQEDRGYKAQIVTYTIAWLVNHLYEQGLELDLDVIWQRQELPEEIGEVLRQIAPQVAATLKDAPPQMKNVGEYCKQQACWAAVAGAKYRFSGSLDGLVIDRVEAEQRTEGGHRGQEARLRHRFRSRDGGDARRHRTLPGVCESKAPADAEIGLPLCGGSPVATSGCPSPNETPSNTCWRRCAKRGSSFRPPPAEPWLEGAAHTEDVTIDTRASTRP